MKERHENLLVKLGPESTENSNFIRVCVAVGGLGAGRDGDQLQAARLHIFGGVFPVVKWAGGAKGQASAGRHTTPRRSVDNGDRMYLPLAVCWDHPGETREPSTRWERSELVKGYPCLGGSSKTRTSHRKVRKSVRLDPLRGNRALQPAEGPKLPQPHRP